MLLYQSVTSIYFLFSHLLSHQIAKTQVESRTAARQNQLKTKVAKAEEEVATQRPAELKHNATLADLRAATKQHEETVATEKLASDAQVSVIKDESRAEQTNILNHYKVSLTKIKDGIKTGIHQRDQEITTTKYEGQCQRKIISAKQLLKRKQQLTDFKKEINQIDVLLSSLGEEITTDKTAANATLEKCQISSDSDRQILIQQVSHHKEVVEQALKVATTEPAQETANEITGLNNDSKERLAAMLETIIKETTQSNERTQGYQEETAKLTGTELSQTKKMLKLVAEIRGNKTETTRLHRQDSLEENKNKCDEVELDAIKELLMHNMIEETGSATKLLSEMRKGCTADFKTKRENALQPVHDGAKGVAVKQAGRLQVDTAALEGPLDGVSTDKGVSPSRGPLSLRAR